MIKLKEVKIKKYRNQTHYISIPKAWFDTGLLDREKVYDVTIEEVIIDGQTNG